jgi:hypothetical protein
MVTHSCNPTAQEVDTGTIWFEASLVKKLVRPKPNEQVWSGDTHL